MMDGWTDRWTDGRIHADNSPWPMGKNGPLTIKIATLNIESLSPVKFQFY